MGKSSELKTLKIARIVKTGLTEQPNRRTDGRTKQGVNVYNATKRIKALKTSVKMVQFR